MAGPICITNTHAVGIAHGGIVKWTAKHHPAIAEAWLLPVAGETWDGYLNDINGGHVTVDTAVAALEAAESGPIEEGSVGGGTGMNCYGYKGGSTTASRVVTYDGETPSNGRGPPPGQLWRPGRAGDRRRPARCRSLEDDDPMAPFFSAPVGAGSCIAIVVTDAPLLPDQCRALARARCPRARSDGHDGVTFLGDLFLAVSTANPGAHPARREEPVRRGARTARSPRLHPVGLPRCLLRGRGPGRGRGSRRCPCRE